MNSQELEHLKDLLVAFPADYGADQVGEANKLSYTRFNQIINEIENISDLIYNEFSTKSKSWLNLTRIFHRLIFQDIISIAGEFRQSSHPYQGRVSFGGQKHNENKHEFDGTIPDKIESNLIEAFNFINDDNNAIPNINALRFYQLFVRTHPFYDGNGRVAQLFVDIYLYHNGLSLNWGLIDKRESKFLHKLNRYHKTNMERDFQYWYKFCVRYYLPNFY